MTGKELKLMQAALPPDPPAAEIVITARALPDPAADRTLMVDKIGSSRLQNAPSTQLDQLLKEVPGLQLFRRSDARTGHPTSQGVTMRALGGNASSRALLILDGVPQADPFGGWVNWPAYDPASLDEVSVTRGGGSVAHGPGALAGAISMTSRVGRGFVTEIAGGSRGSLEGRAVGGFAVGGGTFNLSARGARGDGFVPVSKATRGSVDRAAPYKEASARAYWVKPLTGETDLQLSGLGFTDRRDRGVPFTANRTDGADASVRLLARGRWQWSALGYAQWRELSSSFASVSPDRSTASRVALQHSVPSHAFGASFELRPALDRGIEARLGGDLRRATGESRELSSYVLGEPTRRRRAGGATLTAGMFADVTAKLGRLILNGGARLDHWRIADGELTEHVIASGAPLRDERYPARSGWRPTARMGVAYDLGEGLILRSAAYLGWRLPTLNELFRPFRAGADATAANPFLNPERLAGAELGARYSHDSVTISATAFVNRMSDAIANVTLAQGPGVFPGVGFVSGQFRQRRNLDAIRVRGVEVTAEARRGAFLASLGASFTDSMVGTGGAAIDLDGLRPAQTPRLALSGGITWEKRGRAVSLNLRQVGAQYEDDLNQFRLPAATTLDAFATWPLGRDVQLVARGENLLDELVVAGIGDDGSVERATPRTFWIGLRVPHLRK